MINKAKEKIKEIEEIFKKEREETNFLMKKQQQEFQEKIKDLERVY